MSTGYWLLDRPNPHGQHFYPTRRGSVLACVVHVTAGLQGAPTGVDSSAEQTALYAATTDREVSWHSGSDRDSFLQLLPDGYTAWQCQGYNSRTIGHEISKRDVSWADEDPRWVTETLQLAAACLRPRLAALRIPIRRATRAELDRAIATNGPPVGLIGHSELDPTRRTDPGRDFPWGRFLTLLKPSPPPTPAPKIPEGRPLTNAELVAAVAAEVRKQLQPDLLRLAQYLRGKPNAVFNPAVQQGLPEPKDCAS